MGPIMLPVYALIGQIFNPIKQKLQPIIAQKSAIGRIFNGPNYAARKCANRAKFQPRKIKIAGCPEISDRANFNG
jgi:hypothetical protein